MPRGHPGSGRSYGGEGQVNHLFIVSQKPMMGMCCVRVARMLSFFLKGGTSWSSSVWPMALIVTGGISPNLSGKIGAAVFAHNAGGRYVRNAAAVTNPNTAEQQRVRSALATVANDWTTIGAGDRDQWALFASQVPVTNRLGNQIFLSGIAMYTKCNSLRRGIGLDTVDVGPTTYTLGQMSTMGSVSLSGSTLTLNFTGGDWQDTGGAMVVQASPPQNPSINFFGGSFTQEAVVLGGTATLTAATIGLSAAAIAGQKVFYRLVGTLPDGRPTPVVQGVVVMP